MGQKFFEQLPSAPEEEKPEIELTAEYIENLLREIKKYTAGLLEHEKELEEEMISLGGEAALRAEFEELKHDSPWWRRFEKDLAEGNFESVTMREI